MSPLSKTFIDSTGSRLPVGVGGVTADTCHHPTLMHKTLSDSVPFVTLRFPIGAQGATLATFGCPVASRMCHGVNP